MGLPTASNFAEIMAKGRGGAPSVRRGGYMNKLLAERLSSELDEGYAGGDVMRGMELEDAAISAYEFECGVKVERIGFMRSEVAGASPDGLVGENGLIEVKCPRRHHYVRMVLSGNPAADYMPQIQGQLWLSGRQWCDLVLYSPPLPLFVHRVNRDEDDIGELSEAVQSFAADLAEAEVALRRQLGMLNE